jgi:hypothetical protein
MTMTTSPLAAEATPAAHATAAEAVAVTPPPVRPIVAAETPREAEPVKRETRRERKRREAREFAEARRLRLERERSGAKPRGS